MIVTGILVVLLVGVLVVSVDTFLDERCPRNDRRARRVKRYARATMSDPKTQPNDPDVITEADVLREDLSLDEGQVDAAEDERLREDARDRRRQDQ